MRQRSQRAGHLFREPPFFGAAGLNGLVGVSSSAFGVELAFIQVEWRTGVGMRINADGCMTVRTVGTSLRS